MRRAASFFFAQISNKVLQSFFDLQLKTKKIYSSYFVLEDHLLRTPSKENGETEVGFRISKKPKQGEGCDELYEPHA